MEGKELEGNVKNHKAAPVEVSITQKSTAGKLPEALIADGKKTEKPAEAKTSKTTEVEAKHTASPVQKVEVVLIPADSKQPMYSSKFHKYTAENPKKSVFFGFVAGAAITAGAIGLVGRYTNLLDGMSTSGNSGSKQNL